MTAVAAPKPATNEMIKIVRGACDRPFGEDLVWDLHIRVGMQEAVCRALRCESLREPPLGRAKARGEVPAEHSGDVGLDCSAYGACVVRDRERRPENKLNLCGIAICS